MILFQITKPILFNGFCITLRIKNYRNKINCINEIIYDIVSQTQKNN